MANKAWWWALLAMLPLLGQAAPAPVDGKVQAKAFADLYASLCLEHLGDLDALRARLSSVPRLKPESAAFFLSGQPGDAWAVSDQRGDFVVALPANARICLVYARHADIDAVQRQFTALVEEAPYPFVFTKLPTPATAAGNHTVRTLSYAWKSPGSGRRTLFTLNLDPAGTARPQVMASAALEGR